MNIIIVTKKSQAFRFTDHTEEHFRDLVDSVKHRDLVEFSGLVIPTDHIEFICDEDLVNPKPDETPLLNGK